MKNSLCAGNLQLSRRNAEPCRAHEAGIAAFLAMESSHFRLGDGGRSACMKTIQIQAVVLITLLGCGTGDPAELPALVGAPLTSPNTLTLGNEAFAVDTCEIWGYLGKRDGKWYCRWCIDADAVERTFTDSDEDGPYTFEMQPTLSGNSLPINVSRWRELDGVEFKTGAHGDVDYYDNKDHSAIYTLRSMTSYEECSNNTVAIRHVDGDQFRVVWTGNAFVHGVGGNTFSLDAIATLTKISLSAEIDDVSEVDDDAIRRIFESVFPHGDFTQHPAVIDKFEEDGVLYMSFDADFTPEK